MSVPLMDDCPDKYDLIYAYSLRLRRMVSVDTVDNGLACNCICPCCKVPMNARQGDKRKHHFAHHGPQPANKKLCYLTALHKLAEEIIFEEKRIKTPTYYNIFPSQLLQFKSVELEKRIDRNDLQPDMVGIADNGIRYLIEIKNTHEVDSDKKKKIYENGLICMEIDVSNQRLENLRDFLMNSSENRIWINNPYYFSWIEKYKDNGKTVKLVPATDCKRCAIPCNFFDLKVCVEGNPLVIQNNGKEYYLCKREEGKEYIMPECHMPGYTQGHDEFYNNNFFPEENDTSQKTSKFSGSIIGYDKRFVLCPEEGTQYFFDCYEENLGEGKTFFIGDGYNTKVVKVISHAIKSINVIHKIPSENRFFWTWIHEHNHKVVHEQMHEANSFEEIIKKIP